MVTYLNSLSKTPKALVHGILDECVCVWGVWGQLFGVSLFLTMPERSLLQTKLSTGSSGIRLAGMTFAHCALAVLLLFRIRS